MTDQKSLLFALNATASLGSMIAAHLGEPLAKHEEREFGGWRAQSAAA